MKGFAAFDAVLWWEDDAWLVTTVGECCHVAQGKTPDGAIESLKRSLFLTAQLQLGDGLKPFSDRFPSTDEDNERWRKAGPMPAVPQVDKSYRTCVSVSWDPSLRVNRSPAKGRRSSGRNR